MHQRTILVARDGGKIRLGDNVSVSGTTIYALESVEIGDNTQIGVNTIIMDNDFHPLNITARRMNDRNAIRRKPVRIGNDCFIGMNVIICKGTVLGDRCIVGAGSVVCGVYPDDSVIIGNPAIRKR
jgi:acetyltransferase-like isoleucine patch superfamily enzyme